MLRRALFYSRVRTCTLCKDSKKPQVIFRIFSQKFPKRFFLENRHTQCQGIKCVLYLFFIQNGIFARFDLRLFTNPCRHSMFSGGPSLLPTCFVIIFGLKRKQIPGRATSKDLHRRISQFAFQTFHEKIVPKYANGLFYNYGGLW